LGERQVEEHNWKLQEAKTTRRRKAEDKARNTVRDKGDTAGTGHHQPDWETNELQTSGEPDTTTWTEPDTYLRKD